MRRICVIGNSHLAAIKMGVDQLRNAGDLPLHVDTFGAKRRGLGKLEFKNSAAFATDDDLQENLKWTSGGLTQIDLDSYNDVLLAFGTNPYDFENFAASDAMVPISFSAVSAIVANLMRDRWYCGVVQNLISASSRPNIAFLGRPFVAENSRFAATVFRRLSDFPIDAESYFSELDDRVGDALTRFESERFRVVRPPVVCLDRYKRFTKTKFSRGSVRLEPVLSELHPKRDASHMNADYGVEVMRDLFL